MLAFTWNMPTGIRGQISDRVREHRLSNASKDGIYKKESLADSQAKMYGVQGAFLAEVLQFPRDFFVWVDETGCDRCTNIRKFWLFATWPDITIYKILARISAISAIKSSLSKSMQPSIPPI